MQPINQDNLAASPLSTSTDKSVEKKELGEALFAIVESQERNCEKIQRIQFLIDKGADINWFNERGYTVLQLAVEQEDAELAQYLIKLGANEFSAPLEKGALNAEASLQAFSSEKIHEHDHTDPQIEAFNQENLSSTAQIVEVFCKQNISSIKLIIDKSEMSGAFAKLIIKYCQFELDRELKENIFKKFNEFSDKKHDLLIYAIIRKNQFFIKYFFEAGVKIDEHLSDFTLIEKLFSDEYQADLEEQEIIKNYNENILNILDLLKEQGFNFNCINKKGLNSLHL